MIEDAEYHEMREAQERAIASSLPEGEARKRHLALADQHADRLRLVRNGQVSDMVDLSARKSALRSSTDHSLSQAIHQSRELLAQSHRILAESRDDMSPRS